MRRSALTRMLMCGSLLAGCGEERHVRVVLDVAEGVDVPVVSVAVHAQLSAADGGSVLQRDATLPEGAGTAVIDFPADCVVLIGDASGALVVDVAGRDADQAPVASGSATGAVPAGGDGEVLTLHVVLDRGGPGVGSCGDGVATVGEICWGPALARTAAAAAGAPAAADVDGDGTADLVAVIGGDDPGRGLSVSRGRGSDVFEAPRSVLGPRVDQPGPPEVALGDVDGDGLLDAVLASSTDAPPLLSRGRAEDPWFGLIAPILDGGATPAGLSPVLADLDGDAALDLVTVGSDAVWIGMGAGDGSFSATSVGALTGASRAVAGELDGDAPLELAVALDGTTVRVLDADGTTVAEGDLGGDGNIRALAVADLDGAPPAELVAGVGPEVRWGHVDGATVVSDGALSVGPGRALGLAAAQGSGGAPAVVAMVEEQRSNEDYLPAVVWLTAGAGRSLTADSRARVHCWNGRLGVGDLDGDGESDALLGCGDAGIAIERRVGGQLAVPGKGPMSAGMAVGDIDGDGRPDVVTNWWSLSLMRRADDPNAPDNVEDVPESQGEEIDATFGDFTGDERDDLVSACVEPDPWCLDGTLKRWTANVGGAIEVLPPLPLPALATSVMLGRTVPAAKLRILVTLEDGRILAIDGASGVTEAEASGAPSPVWRSAAGPLDATAGDDAVVVGEDGRVVAFLGDGSGGLADGVEIATAPDATGLAVGDVDGDGVAEIVLTQNDSTNVQVLRLAGQTAEDAGTFAAGLSPDAVSALDVDGDGQRELLLGGEDAIEVWSLHSGLTLRFVMAGLDSYGAPFAIFSLPGDGDAWVPPILFGLGRWDIEGDDSWQEYVMSWHPNP